MKNNSLWRAAGIMMLCTIIWMAGLSSPAAIAQAEGAEQSKTLHIVGLGDSITFGYEPDIYQVSGAPTGSVHGYMEMLREQALFHGRNTMVNYAISGLTSEGLLHLMSAAQSGDSIFLYEIQPTLQALHIPNVKIDAAQFTADLAKADVIPMTIGGNDILELIRGTGSIQTSQIQQKLEPVLLTYKEHMKQVITSLHAVNSDAVILLGDQYQPFPAFAAGADLYAELGEAAKAYTAAVKQVVEEAKQQGVNIQFVSITAPFVGKELSLTHMLQLDIHPNQAGYEAIAQLMAEAIWGEYRKVSVPASGQPMNIIVDGVQLQSPYKPVVRESLNYVSVKDIANAIGAETKYDNKTESITITKDNNTVVMKVGSSRVQVNSEMVEAGAAVFLHKVGQEMKTYVPLSLLAKGLGLDVTYVSQYRSVFINS